MFEEDSILQLDLSFGRTTPTTRVKLILSRIMSNPISIDMYLFSLQSDCEWIRSLAMKGTHMTKWTASNLSLKSINAKEISLFDSIFYDWKVNKRFNWNPFNTPPIHDKCKWQQIRTKSQSKILIIRLWNRFTPSHMIHFPMPSYMSEQYLQRPCNLQLELRVFFSVSFIESHDISTNGKEIKWLHKIFMRFCFYPNYYWWK